MSHSWVSATLETTLTMTKKSRKVVGNWSRLQTQFPTHWFITCQSQGSCFASMQKKKKFACRYIAQQAFQLHILCWRTESLRMGTYNEQGILLFSACYQLSKDLDQNAKQQQQNWDGCWAVEHQQKLQIETHNIHRVCMKSTYSWRQFEIQEAQVGFWLE